MKRRLWSKLGLPLLGTLIVGVAACSNGGGTQPGVGALPDGVQNAAAVRETASGLILRPPGPYTGVTPPFKPGETLTYAWNRSNTTTTWNGPTASPSTGPANTATATFTDAFSVDKKTGIYTEVLTDKTTEGGAAAQAILFGFVADGTSVKQVAYFNNDVSTGNGGFTYNSLITYPRGDTFFVYPAKSGSQWSAAADSITSYSQGVPNSYALNGSNTNGADGSYVGQDQFAQPGYGGGYAEQDEFAYGKPLTYVLSIPGYQVNPETWTFGDVKNKKIPVKTSGTAPLKYPAGTTQVPNWYPGGGALPQPAYADDYTVTGTVQMPSACGKLSGKNATDVTEKYQSLDPIFGVYTSYTFDYYLDATDTTVCMNWVDLITYYANGNSWESAGSWGGPWHQQNYTASWVLTGKKAASTRALAAMPVIPHPIGAARLRGVPTRLLLNQR